MPAIIHIEMFTPAEAADLTGIGSVLQRDHRRRFPEWLPRASGHARFDLYRCFQMRFVADVGEFALGPSKAYAIGEWVAHHALQFALLIPGCMSGDLRREVTMPDASDDDVHEHTARRVFVHGFGRPRMGPSEYAFIWGDGTDWFGPSMEECLSRLPDEDPRRGKPMMVLHLPSFAAQVVARLPRPAVRIIQEQDA